MNFWETVVLGIVQGVTEWLPVSSSGHLVLFEKLLNLPLPVEFDIFLHLASLAVVLIFFRKEIQQIIQVTLFPNKADLPERRRWFWYLLLSTAITGVIGWLLYPLIEEFRNLDSVAGWLLITTFLLVAAFFSRPKSTMSLWPAVVLGAIQGLAVLPGLSRSGALIAMALILGLNKKDAFDYAFLLSIPAIAGSFLISYDQLSWHWLYAMGFAVTFVVGYATLILLKQILRRNLFPWFFLYTLAISLIIIIFG